MEDTLRKCKIQQKIMIRIIIMTFERFLKGQLLVNLQWNRAGV